MRRTGGITIGTRGGTSVACQPGRVQVTNPSLFVDPAGRWGEFVARVSQLTGVEWVEIDRRRGMAIVGYTSRHKSLSEFLEQLATALCGNTGAPPAALSLPPGLEKPLKFRLVIRDGRISPWQIVHELPGRMRLRDPRLADDGPLAGQLVGSLRQLPGVRGATASTLTGSLLLHYDGTTISRNALLAYLDHWDRGRVEGVPALAAPPSPNSRLKWASAHATLALAVTGTLFYPPLLPISAGLLIASNLKTFGRAVAQLCRGQVGVPLLHTSIVAMTLATGGFIASSLMNWLLLYWEDRQGRLTASGHQLLMHAVAPPTATAWVVRDGVELETPVARLEPGAVIRVRAGEWIPVDGQILSGHAILSESAACGSEAQVTRGQGDEVFAGACVLDGELLVETHRTADATLAATIARTLAGTASSGGPVHGTRAKPGRFAERAVPATLMTAGLGLLVADPVTAGAILRPDYATGPGLGNTATFINRLAACLDEGIVIRQAEAFLHMARADVILLDEESIRAARDLRLEDIHVVGDLSTGELLACAECAARPFSDQRTRALQAACELRGRARLTATGTYRAGSVEFEVRGRSIRVEGLSRSRRPDGDADPDEVAHPLRVYCEGSLAGVLTFCTGTDASVAAAIAELKTKGELRVELLSTATPAEARALGDRLGVDDVRICPSDQSRAQLIEILREDGLTVVFAGDCLRFPLAARAAQLSIYPAPRPIAADHATGDIGSEEDAAGVWLLQPDFSKLARLRDISSSLESRSRWNCGMILAPNLACVAGAFLFGFTSLAVVVLSNLATFTMYSRSLRELRLAEQRLRERRGRLTAAPSIGTAPQTGLPVPDTAAPSASEKAVAGDLSKIPTTARPLTSLSAAPESTPLATGSPAEKNGIREVVAAP